MKEAILKGPAHVLWVGRSIDWENPCHPSSFSPFGHISQGCGGVGDKVFEPFMFGMAKVIWRMVLSHWHSGLWALLTSEAVMEQALFHQARPLELWCYRP